MKFIEKLHRKNSIESVINRELVVVILSETREKRGQSIKGTLLNKSIFSDVGHLPSIKSGCRLLVVKQKELNEIYPIIKDALIIKWGSKTYTYRVLDELKDLNSQEVILRSVQVIIDNFKQVNQLIQKDRIELCAILNRSTKTSKY